MSNPMSIRLDQEQLNKLDVIKKIYKENHKVDLSNSSAIGVAILLAADRLEKSDE